MDTMKTLLKLTAAAAAIAGIAYLVVKYKDNITEWLKNICPCKDVPIAEEVDVDEIGAEEAPVEEPVAEEEVVAEEPATEVEIPEGEPVAEESDFEA